VLAAASDDPMLLVTTPSLDDARELVRKGQRSVGVVIPAGFGDRAGQAFFGGTEKPTLTFLFDPSRSTELAVVRGVMTEHIMQAVSAEMFSGPGGQRLIDQTLAGLDGSRMSGAQQTLLRQLLTSARSFYQSSTPTDTAADARPRRGITMPYQVKEEAMTSGDHVAYNGYAHSFAGMGIQFLLFASIDLGIGVLLERQRGLWKRLRSAPLSRFSLLGAKALSGTLISLATLLVSFGFAVIVFKVRIAGSLIGFFAVSISCAMMAASFGLLIASLGETPGGSRGIASLGVLMMVMLGGAWVPTFIFPQWLQRLTVIVPARWAVDGLDAMTWRGLGIHAALAPTAALLGFALLFTAVALARFRWDEP
jgi:ABC-2 type transport system permease protein